MNNALRRNLTKISLIFLTCATFTLGLETAIHVMPSTAIAALAAVTLTGCLLLRALLPAAVETSVAEKLAAKWQALVSSS